ncbi:MAG: ADP-ribosylglycohydrolase family protein [Kiritimatiellaeota bacterium]|nr:ADP-ribosylglycohydrolase family protein [Kiritimatiellota bacterium]
MRKCLCSMIALSVVASAAMGQGERRLTIEQYRDRMFGGWVGQIAGVCWGAPTEFKWNDTIIPMSAMPKWTPEMINEAFGQDDLYVEMTFLRSLEEYGLDVSIRQAGIDFANSEYQLWCANDAGRKNLRKGIAPPDSSHPQFNKCPNDIDYQIEADFAGLISPGMPNSVVALGETFGRIMNYGDGVYGGQFVGAMLAEAFFTDDIQKIIAAGLAAIPAESQYAEMARDMVKWHRENPDDWQDAWRLSLKKYRQTPAYQKASNGGIDVKINGACVLMGLLYGNGDMDQTIIIATRCGWDSDCNPSSAAGVLGTALGYGKLPEKFKEKLDMARKFDFTAYNIPELKAVCEKLARQIVVQQGGRVEGDVFIIPHVPAKPSPLELSWDPGPIANSRFTEEEYAKVRFKPHAAEIDDPAPTKRVQGALDVLLPGWTASANGSDMNPGYRAEHHGRKDVVMTHPLNRDTGVTLSRELNVPEDTTKLMVTIANHANGDFTFVAKIDGEEILQKKIGQEKDGKVDWQTLTVDLSPYAGKHVKVELVNQPDGWQCEAAYWGAIEIK